MRFAAFFKIYKICTIMNSNFCTAPNSPDSDVVVLLPDSDFSNQYIQKIINFGEFSEKICKSFFSLFTPKLQMLLNFEISVTSTQ